MMNINSRILSAAAVFALLFGVAQEGLANKPTIEIEFLGRYVVPVFDAPRRASV